MLDATFFAGACALADRGVIRARGADAATFLQGQLTNDVLTLAPGRARLAGFCSAKGRLQASFIVWRPAPDELLLLGAADLLAATLKRLTMFVMRAKCVLTDATAELSLEGLAGAAAVPAALHAAPAWTVEAHDGATLLRLPDVDGVARALHVAPRAVAAASSAPALALDRWRWLDVHSGIVTIEAATVDRFVPQMVNHELVGAVDFKKGCYPGQEVVARSQYRGTLKRRTFLFECAATPRAGEDVFADGGSGEPVGLVASAAAAPAGLPLPACALVEMRLSAMGTAALRLAAADGPLLQPAALPYEIPFEAEAPA